MIVWNEPDENGQNKVFKISKEEAIEIQKASAKRFGIAYESDEQALSDFIIVNWAREEEP